MNIKNIEITKDNIIPYILIVFIAVSVVFTSILMLTAKKDDCNTIASHIYTEVNAPKLENDDISCDEYVSNIEKTFINTFDLYELNQLIEETYNKMNAAYEMEKAARILGYQDVVNTAIEDYQYNLDANAYYTERYDYIINTFYANLQQSYPAATTIWLSLKTAGYNDYVCAGILGNIMNECGNNSLSLNTNVWSSNSKYYGICQWDRNYYPAVVNTNLETQIEFLLGNIKGIFDTYGDYNAFTKCTDERDAALMFARCYERCTMYSYTNRQTNANKAYTIFHMDENSINY